MRTHNWRTALEEIAARERLALRAHSKADIEKDTGLKLADSQWDEIRQTFNTLYRRESLELLSDLAYDVVGDPRHK